MNDLRTSLKKLNWKIDGKIFGFGTSPEADWRIIFISTIILIASVITLGVFVFRQTNQTDIFMPGDLDVPEGQILDTSVLRETILYYQNKESEFGRIKNSALLVPADPSLKD